MKDINKRYGFEFGDALLKKFGEFLEEQIEPVHVPARYTADEFMIVLIGENEKGALKKAEEIMEYVTGHPLKVKDEEITLSLNMGIAELTSGMSYNELMNRVEEALFESKKRGQNKIVTSSDIE